jgi:hypothetical protein
MDYDEVRMNELNELFEAIRYDATHGTNEAILAEARERYAAGVPVRGLPRPHDAPDDAWYTVQERPLANGQTAASLMLRWRIADEAGGKRTRSLGRLN